MIDQIEQNTEQIKLYLIQLGFFLTPPTQMHPNKLTQINEEFKEISKILKQQPAETLFENVGQVVTALTTNHHIIHSLEDVNRVVLQTKKYIEDYLK
tara:strand:+ start:1983 stop:2273 length:291 start_codon:yes stop_codon:yes gene_type:complete